MTSLDWSWDAIEAVNLSNAPTDTWEEAYHWLDDEVSDEVVVKISEELDYIAYIVEVGEQ